MADLGLERFAKRPWVCLSGLFIWNVCRKYHQYGGRLREPLLKAGARKRKDPRPLRDGAPPNQAPIHRVFRGLGAHAIQRVGRSLIEIQNLVTDMLVGRPRVLPNEPDRGQRRFRLVHSKLIFEIGHAANEDGEGIGFLADEKSLHESVLGRIAPRFHP
jgi:hypothetical protein